MHELVKNMKEAAQPVFYGRNGLFTNPFGFLFWSTALGAATIIFGNVFIGSFEKIVNGEEK